MSNHTNTASRRPTHTVWFVPERENAPWTVIGSAWPVKDGNGFSLTLDLVPRAAGRVMVLQRKEKEEEQG